MLVQAVHNAMLFQVVSFLKKKYEVIGVLQIGFQKVVIHNLV
jgi:hypothetical protein